MDKWRVFGVGAIVGCCVTVLGACTTEPEPVVTGTPTGVLMPSPSESASPTESAGGEPLTRAELLEQLPPNAGEADVQGAIVTAEFFAELYGTMLTTGDTELWDELSGPDCEFCADSAATSKEYAQTSAEVVGGQVTVDASRTRGNANNDGFTYVGLVVSQKPIHVTSSNGETESFEAGDFGLAIRMSFVEGAWQVVGVDVVEPEEIPR